MLSSAQVEDLNDAIQQMDRKQVCNYLANFPARFPIDFTPDFFGREPIGRLRHILFGLCLHNQRMIDVAVAA